MLLTFLNQMSKFRRLLKNCPVLKFQKTVAKYYPHFRGNLPLVASKQPTTNATSCSKYCQAVCEPNHCLLVWHLEKRVLRTVKPSQMLFSPTSIWLECHSKMFFRKKGMPAKLNATVQHPYKVQVWAGLSK